MTDDTPIYTDLRNEVEEFKRLAAIATAMSEPLPHRKPNLTRINHTINERFRKLWELS